ncbi:cation diffusion facilitator family transporter [Spizellomyces punctatus DAOM BR117]|uniref:Cation diffusion facilitator family transporter n=1 Tax=Spizellomyces punctatus (strain DAOM BR117) TaxID=645134 RepID=A0A0L0H724_SPIPD|nr:cation diffusion facilitator family transporter [Spizellomyces punctatus DAOM BR117]KNC97037.1 cation diffusion facilitator family transporter [Spizellomyces punctatus DAOM BR117]|eukprot:XP_016605077.1 cation diffusion facilitator family transporter [Spizellomyces punctatus DAOM BR117]
MLQCLLRSHSGFSHIFRCHRWSTTSTSSRLPYGSVSISRRCTRTLETPIPGRFIHCAKRNEGRNDVSKGPTAADIGEYKSQVRQLKREVTEVKSKINRKKTLQGSQKVVGLAMMSNIALFSGKLYAAIQSGSASMFSEALHSLADALNESLLMWGIWRSLREPDPQHPYGFTAERYAWALVSGVGVFFLGGGVSIYHGISGLMAAHHALGDVTSSWIVLGASLLFEGGTMTYAWRHISKSAEAAGVSVLEYLRRGADPTAVQVFMEDCAAVAGVVVAGSCLTLSKLLNLPVIDSIGSITIGILLSCVATFLIRRNIAGLVETSMPAHRQAEIVRELESDPVVSSVQDIKSTALGPEWARFKAEILFNGEEVTRRYITRNPELFAMEYEQLKKLKTREEVEVWLERQGGRVVSTLGSEVDRLEFNIMTKRPEVKHIDLEIL